MIRTHSSRPTHTLKIPQLLLGIILSVIMIATPLSAMAESALSQNRAKEFASSAKEFGVPQDILLAISYNQTRWEDHEGTPSASGGYGLMHLTTNPTLEDGRGDPARPLREPVRPKTATLHDAAAALSLPASTLKTDKKQNIRGAAALLSRYAKEQSNGQLPRDISGWYTAVAKLSGATTVQSAQSFADDVFATLRDGVSRTTSDGQMLSVARHTIKMHAEQLKTLGLVDDQLRTQQTDTAECPPTLSCDFVPARFAQNNSNDSTDYGNYDTANRPHDMPIKYIVIHDTEGSYQSAVDWFRDPRSYVAANYVIRSSDGKVTQMVKNKDVGWHAGNWYMNMHSIGIEHEGYSAQGGAWYTEAMYRSSAKLVRYLAQKYGIPLDRQHIVGHSQYQGTTPARATTMHTDPGPYWDWDHYMQLIGAPQLPEMNGGNAVTIRPIFAQNKQLVTECKEGVCTALPTQGSNFVYIRTQPDTSAPLVSDAGLHPDGTPGTTKIGDVSARATTGQRYIVAERKGNWTAIWFNGQKGWFHDPSSQSTAQSSYALAIRPRAGKASIPIYGRPTPEASAFKPDTTPLTITPLQYKIRAGQSYPLYDPTAARNDYFQVLTFDRSKPGDGSVTIGKERYVPIEYSHRQAYVKASDITFGY